jgi:hypothetical protein
MRGMTSKYKFIFDMELIALGGISGIGLGLIAATYPIARITNTFATALADAIMTDVTALMVESD